MKTYDFSNWKQNFGKNLKKIRRSKGHTQQQLSELLDVDVTTISKMENSVVIPGVKTLVELSTIYGITIDELLAASK